MQLRRNTDVKAALVGPLRLDPLGVLFYSEGRAPILLHKPHPRKELLEYQVKQLLEVLEQEGFEPQPSGEAGHHQHMGPRCRQGSEGEKDIGGLRAVKEGIICLGETSGLSGQSMGWAFCSHFCGVWEDTGSNAGPWAAGRRGVF